MKKIACIIMCCLSIVTSVYSQAESDRKTIRSLARIHIFNTEDDPLNENKKLIDTDPIEMEMDYDAKNRVDIPKGYEIIVMDQIVYDVKNRVDITDDSMLVPISDTLSHYRILKFGPHTYRHPMFAKNGKYAIINMRKDLSEIIGQYNDIHNELTLNESESRYVLQDILNYYERNFKGGGWVPISIKEREEPLESTNIWEITNKFLVENGELDSGANTYPESTKPDEVVFPFFIVTPTEIISDPDFVIPFKKELVYYSFGKFAPNGPMHLIFFKTGKWYMINMHKTLPEIMTQFAKMCEELLSYNKDIVSACKEVLKVYDMNQKIKEKYQFN